MKPENFIQYNWSACRVYKWGSLYLFYSSKKWNKVLNRQLSKKWKCLYYASVRIINYLRIIGYYNNGVFVKHLYLWTNNFIHVLNLLGLSKFYRSKFYGYNRLLHNVSMRVKIPKHFFVESDCVLLILLYNITRLSMASTGKNKLNKHHELKNNFLDKTVLLSDNLRAYTLFINIMVHISVYSFLVYKVIIQVKT